MRAFRSPPERTLKDSNLYAAAASLAGPGEVMRGFLDARFVVKEAVRRAELAGGGAARAGEFARAFGLDRMDERHWRQLESLVAVDETDDEAGDDQEPARWMPRRDESSGGWLERGRGRSWI